MRDQEVRVRAHRRARVNQQLLESNRTLRHAACVLDNQHVTRHQLRPCDACKLIIRKVPRLHTEQHAEWARFHMGFADLRVELRRRQERFGMPRVVVENVGAEIGFSACLVNPLAHFERRQSGEFVNVCAQQRGCLGNNRGALRIAGFLPRMEACLSRRQRFFELLVVQFIEALQCLAVIRVDALVGHGLALFQWECAGVRWMRPSVLEPRLPGRTCWVILMSRYTLTVPTVQLSDVPHHAACKKK